MDEEHNYMKGASRLCVCIAAVKFKILVGTIKSFCGFLLLTQWAPTSGRVRIYIFIVCRPSLTTKIKRIMVCYNLHCQHLRPYAWCKACQAAHGMETLRRRLCSCPSRPRCTAESVELPALSGQSIHFIII
jgi:hypothetical protein